MGDRKSWYFDHLHVFLLARESSCQMQCHFRGYSGELAPDISLYTLKHKDFVYHVYQYCRRLPTACFQNRHIQELVMRMSLPQQAQADCRDHPVQVGQGNI